MTEQTVNIPLLRKAVEWAEAEAARPAIDCRWIQESWLTPADYRAADLLDGTDDECNDSALKAVEHHCGTAYCIAGWVAQSIEPRYATEQEVEGVHLSTFAADALGIPEDATVFNGWITIADVRRIAESLAGERL